MKKVLLVVAFVGVLLAPLFTNVTNAQHVQAVTIPADWRIYTRAAVPIITNIPSELPLGSVEKIEAYEAPRFNTVGVTWQIYNPKSGKNNLMFNTSLHTIQKHFASVQEAIDYRQWVAQVLLDQILESAEENSTMKDHMVVELYAILYEQYYANSQKYTLATYKMEVLTGVTEFIREPNGTWHLAEDIHKAQVLSNWDYEGYLMVQFPQNIKSAMVIKTAPYYYDLITYIAENSGTGNLTNPGTFEIDGQWLNIPYSLITNGVAGGTLRILLADGTKLNYDISTGKRYDGPLPLKTTLKVDGTKLSLSGTGEFGAAIVIETSSDFKTWRHYDSFTNSKSGAWAGDLIDPSGPRKFFRVRYR